MLLLMGFDVARYVDGADRHQCQAMLVGPGKKLVTYNAHRLVACSGCGYWPRRIRGSAKTRLTALFPVIQADLLSELRGSSDGIADATALIVDQKDTGLAGSHNVKRVGHPCAVERPKRARRLRNVAERLVYSMQFLADILDAPVDGRRRAARCRPHPVDRSG